MTANNNTGKPEDQDFETSFDDALILESFDVAKKQLDAFKVKYGESVSYHYKSGQYYWKVGQIKKAYEIFKSLYFNAPVYMHDRNDFEAIKREHIKPKLEKAKAHWKQIVAKASKFIGENPGAIDSEDAEPYVKIFWKKQREQIKAVIELYLQILNIERYERDALIGLIQCYAELENKEKSKYYEDLVSESKLHWKDLVKKRTKEILIAKKKQEDGKHYQEAIEIINLGLETDPTSGELLTSKADCLQHLGYFQEALACIYTALKINPKNSIAFRMKKTIEAQKFTQNLKTGMDFLFQAEQQQPGSPEQLRKVESALSYFLEALSYDNTNLTALAGIYRCHLRAGNPVKGQKTLERIRSIDSNFDVYSIFRNSGKKSQQSTEACYVATRVFGENDARTNLLRNFRDNYLLEHFSGIIFIKLYRKVGPSMAKLSKSGPFLHFVRKTLNFALQPFLNRKN